MGTTVAGVVAGVLVGLAVGGRWRHIGEHPLEAWPLLAAGIALQLPVGVLSGRPGQACLLVSYGLLLAFVGWNVVRTGMPIVLAGLLLNAAVIVVDDGMPVGRAAIAAAGGAGRLAGIHLTGKHHLASRSDHLMALADVIPVPPLHEVVAVGDVLVAVGVMVVVAALMRPPRRTYVPLHRRGRGAAGAGVARRAGLTRRTAAN